MRVTRLKNTKGPLYLDAIALYEKSFDTANRRDADEQRRVMSNEKYHFEIVEDGDDLCGLILYWETDSFIVIEHLCTASKNRSQEYATYCLDSLKQKNKLIVVDVYNVSNELNNAYKSFFENNGFLVNEYKHTHVKYRHEDFNVDSTFMSYNRKMNFDEFGAVNDFLLKYASVSYQNVSNLVISRATLDDNLSKISELIYYSDNYIYPYMFNGVEEGKIVIENMIKLDTIYNLKNLLIAKVDGEIVGVLVSIKKPFVLSYNEYKKSFENANIVYNEKHERIWKEYYSLFDNKENDTYIANICVSSSCRGKGVGWHLLNEIFKQDTKFSLECVQSNENALNLYKKLGFEIIYGYPGFTGIPCYKMIK